MGWRRRAVRLALFVFVIAALLAWINREALLRGTGTFLLDPDAVAKADVAVVMRGDDIRFDRTVKAAALMRAGWTDRIYVSSALDDLAARDLAAKGVVLPSAQDNIVSVLVQRGVPCERIVVDAGPPGGGTAGEPRRLRAFCYQAVEIRAAGHELVPYRRVKRTAAAILPEFRLAVVAADDEDVAALVAGVRHAVGGRGVREAHGVEAGDRSGCRGRSAVGAAAGPAGATGGGRRPRSGLAAGRREAVSDRKKFVREWIANGASVAVLAVTGLLLNGLIAKWYGSAALGIFNQVFAVLVFASQIATAGVQFSVLRHLPPAAEDPA